MAEYSTHQIDSDVVPSPVAFSVLHPNGPTQGLPVLLFLHGGGSDESSLAMFRDSFEEAWNLNVLPPALVVTPSAQRSFYLDYASRDQLWETFILDEFLPHVRTTFGTSEVTVISGISMGGMGSLRMAFRRPDMFAAVAAIEPAIEASAAWPEVLLRIVCTGRPRCCRRCMATPWMRNTIDSTTRSTSRTRTRRPLREAT